MNINIHFIRAAIHENTGVKLSLEETRDILIDEGLLTLKQSKGIIFRGYGEFYNYFYKQDENLAPEKKESLTLLDVVEVIKQNNDSTMKV